MVSIMARCRFQKMLVGTHFLEKQAKIILMGNCLQRSSHFNEGLKLQHHEQIAKNYFCQSEMPDYPETKQLPVPSNIKYLDYSEKLKFSPLRHRDISGLFISSFTSQSFKDIEPATKSHIDNRVECYDCSGTINLSSVMQTNVPFPFTSRGKPIHLNMPGGQWGQKEKYVSEDLNNAHHINSKQLRFSTGGSFILAGKTSTKNLFVFFSVVDPMFSNSISTIFSFNGNQLRVYSTKKNKVDITENLDEKHSTPNFPPLSRKEKLKAAVKDYGAVVIVFHVAISLVSLGCCYAVIASGIDLSSIFKDFGADEGAATAGNAARFVIAYAIHKSLAPGRIAVTLTAVPFIVRKLRKIGYLKAPQPKAQ